MQFAERDFLKNSLRKMLNSTHAFLLESVLLIILVFSVRKIPGGLIDRGYQKLARAFPVVIIMDLLSMKIFQSMKEYIPILYQSLNRIIN